MCRLPLTLFLILATVFAYPLPAAGDPDWASVINVAGRQRMLTQRITRTHVQAGLGANAVLASEQLAESMREFERQHEELVKLDLPADIRNTLRQVEAGWARFRALAGGEYTPGKLGQLVELDTELLQKCERVVYLLEEMTGSRQGRLVNISGRQRMLSQRLVKNYMLLSAGLDTPAVIAQLDDDRAEFRKSLNTLMSERNYSPGIGLKLAEVAEQWVWVESALDSMVENYYPIIVADAGEKTLILLESLTRMYAVVEEDQARH